LAIHALIYILILCRKKLSNMDLAVSANVAYEEVTLEAKERERGYENVEMILQSSHQLTEGDVKRARSIKLGTSKSKASEDFDKADAV
jgi:hypothetical protein